MDGRIANITENDFNQFISTEGKLVIVDFWAPWCAPCKNLAPVLEDIADIFASDIIIGKVNVDNGANLASSYNIRSIPNLIFFQAGQVIDQIIGCVPKDQLIATIQKHLQ